MKKIPAERQVFCVFFELLNGAKTRFVNPHKLFAILLRLSNPSLALAKQAIVSKRALAILLRLSNSSLVLAKQAIVSKRALAVLLSLLSPSLALGQYQVCSLTINSSDEIETFKKFLPQNDFQFIELVPTASPNQQDINAHWFDAVCQQDYQCDILVVSGHFAGLFFGKSGYSLPLELLEEKTCASACSGILSQVKEIFLFGCNTLADKTKDRRTHTEYLQVLLDDGMARETAEQVVAARYSPLGTPFHARMNFIFKDSGAIYGFDELSPLGPQARAPLERYFTAIRQKFGGYSAYLSQEGWKRKRNKELLTAFSHTSLNQARLSLDDETEEQRLFFNNKCLLYDSAKPLDERMRALAEVFSANRAGSAFFAIEHFLNENKKQALEGAGRREFRSIRNNTAYREEFSAYYPHLDFLPYIQLVYLNVLEKFRWIDPIDLALLRRQAFIEMISTADVSAYISLLLLLRESHFQPGSVYISRQDLPEDYFQNIWGLLILEKLRADAYDWQEDIIAHCQHNFRNEPALCYQALNTLAHIRPKRDLAVKLASFLDQNDSHLHYYSLRALGQSGAEDCSIHNRISMFLFSPDPSIRVEALEALGFLRSSCETAQTNMARLLPFADEELLEKILWSFSQMELNSALAAEAIVRLGIESQTQEALARLIFLALRGAGSFSDTAKSFFQARLEARDNIDLLLFVVESLAQNPNIRDVGVFMRFLRFQDESLYLKREALKRLTLLRWIHPETQISFLNWLKDEDPEVRGLAVRVLKNIQNLQHETLIRWREICMSDDLVRPLCAGLRFRIWTKRSQSAV